MKLSNLKTYHNESANFVFLGLLQSLILFNRDLGHSMSNHQKKKKKKKN